MPEIDMGVSTSCCARTLPVKDITSIAKQKRSLLQRITILQKFCVLSFAS